MGELLFFPLLISALGAVMDVGMSISSTVFEIHTNNPELSKKELFRSGMNVAEMPREPCEYLNPGICGQRSQYSVC